MRYTRDIVLTGEILRFTPTSLQQSVNSLYILHGKLTFLVGLLDGLP